MKTSAVVTISVVLSSLVSIGGSYVVTTNIVRQEIDQKVNIATEQKVQLVKQELTQLVRKEITQIGEQAARGGIVLQGGSTIGTMSGVIAK